MLIGEKKKKSSNYKTNYTSKNPLNKPIFLAFFGFFFKSMVFKKPMMIVKKIFKKEIFKKKNFILLTIFLSTFTIFFTVYYNFKQKQIDNNYTKLINNLYLAKTFNNLFNKFEPRIKIINHTVKSGDTFNEILNQYSISDNDKKEIKKQLNNYKFNKLTIDKNIIIKIDQFNQGLIEFVYPVSSTKKIILKKVEKENQFIFDEVETKLIKKIIYKEDIITHSLYKSAINNKIQPSIIIDFARIYGFQIDFQRDIKKQDTFQILYEVYENNKNKIIETGEILYANLKTNGMNNELYYFDDKKDRGHYDPKGKSIKKALMKTPINGARLSSSFGMRKHPIDGFNKMHRGTDFAAPLGTPIMASGDGLIVKVGWCGGGGNCVKIRHNKTYQTVYAHMSKFSGISKKGNRVKQGQIIGFVGSTGKSTGPHLHYEVIENGKRINSQKLRLPSGKILKGSLRKKFETQKIKLDVLKSEKILGL